MMFLSAILLALLVGALLGGGVPRLAQLNLRWLPLLGLALAFRILALLGGQRLGTVFLAEAGLLLTYGVLCGGRLVLIDANLYAPDRDKYAYLVQFERIARTFRCADA